MGVPDKAAAFASSPGPALAFLQDLAKRWLAHDGLWFQAVEKEYGMAAAVKMDVAVWAKFTVIEAERIKRFQELPENGGLTALATAVALRLFSFINRQETVFPAAGRMVFCLNECRVQAARRRKNLPDFPCKEVGVVEYGGFARTIDSRIETRCLVCPPDEHPAEYFCAWEFSLPGDAPAETPLTNPVPAVLESPERSVALMEDLARRWLAHDGLWFQAVEQEYGMETAVRLDTVAWAKFTVLEAERIRKLLDLPPGGGIVALKEALPLRLGALANEQEVVEAGEKKLILRTGLCRVQAARSRKQTAFFPCREVALVQHSGFARAIDPRITTRCLACSPDQSPDGYYCAWEFSL